MTSPKQSLRTKILRYFEDNPEEELSRQDVATKFGAKQKSVDVVLSRMRALGELEPAHVWRKPGAPVNVT